jgi:arylsulfatase A-like enzyme
MDFLEKENLAEHTAILFMSDNGGLSAVARGGERHTHNAPLSSGKGSIREGGIREPMMVKWPKEVRPNTICDQYLIIEDFFATILAIAGVEAEVKQTVDGQSFVPLLKGEEMPKRPLFWHYPNSWGPTGPGIGAYSAIRLEDWKLIYYHDSESFELFNITKDIGETNNLAAIEKDHLLRLADQLSAYLISVDAQMPSHKATGEQVAWPRDAAKKL